MGMEIVCRCFQYSLGTGWLSGRIGCEQRTSDSWRLTAETSVAFSRAEHVFPSELAFYKNKVEDLVCPLF